MARPNGTKLGDIYGGEKYGELTFAQPGAPGNIKPGDYYTVKVAVYGYVDCEANGGILLIYRE